MERILENHGIKTKTERGHLFAMECGTIYGASYTAWVDVTGWTRKQLLNWLGY